MNKQINELNEKMVELFLQYEKIQVLIRDLYNGYFGIVNEKSPDTLNVINLYFKPNSIKCGIIIDLLPQTDELFKEITDKLEKLAK